MINRRPLELFTPLGGGLVRPLYADYSFANIPTTIEYLLTGEQRGPLLPPDCFGGRYPTPRTVVLFFIDAFGWRFWEEAAARLPACAAIVERGVVTPISALFPSTTSASVSTMSLGVLPSRHALYEWNIYIEAYGEVIQSLPFSPLGMHGLDGCRAKGYDPTLLLREHETVYQRLSRRGVTCLQFVNRGYAQSAYNVQIAVGARQIEHRTLAEALVAMRQALEEPAGRRYLTFYWGDIDSIGHVYGPGSAYHAAEVTSFWRTFEAVFGPLAADGETLFLFTADHGMMGADPRTTIYLNETLPELTGLLRRTPAGGLVYPNGSPRDLFLHLAPGAGAGARALLEQALAGRALVLSVDEALAAGLFGPPPYDPEFRRRLGDLILLPHQGVYIWWHEEGLLDNHFFGHHGGLSPEELMTVLAAVGP